MVKDVPWEGPVFSAVSVFFPLSIAVVIKLRRTVLYIMKRNYVRYSLQFSLRAMDYSFIKTTRVLYSPDKRTYWLNKIDKSKCENLA